MNAVKTAFLFSLGFTCLAYLGCSTSGQEPTQNQNQNDNAGETDQNENSAPEENQNGNQEEQPAEDLTMTCTAFEHNGAIPAKYTVDGDGVSPPLSWSNVPEGTLELALICDDPDAPTEDPFVHWVIYKISPDLTGLLEDIPTDESLADPAGVLQGINNADSTGYTAPGPPEGDGPHRYFFTLYALDTELAVVPGLLKQDLLDAMAGHILAQTELMGTFER